MKTPTRLVAAALVLVPFTHVQAQNPNETETALLDRSAQEAAVSEEELEIFADIYVDLEETSTKFETELARIETEQEARDLQAQMQRETQEKIERHGWSQQRYEEVNQAVNSSPELLQRALELIEERS